MALALAVALLARLRHRDWRWSQHLGLALLVWPFALLFVGIVRTYHLLNIPTFLEPYSTASMWNLVWDHTWRFLLVPLVGLVLLHRRVPGRDLPLHDGWVGVHEALSRSGVDTRLGLRRDLANGFALFLPLLVAYLLGLLVLYDLLAGYLLTGNESQLWINLNVPLIVALSLASSVPEELLFRGVLLSWLRRWMPAPAAVVLQAIFFGFTHAGYGTWAHVVGPLLFGLGMGWVALRLGIVPTMVLHGTINAVFFAAQVPEHPGAWVVAGLVVLASLVAAWSVRSEPYRRLLTWSRDGDPPGGGRGWGARNPEP